MGILKSGVLAFASLLLLVSCTEKPEPAQTSKMTLTFGKYYTEKGTVKTPLWSGGALAGAIDIENGKGATAKALGSDDPSAIFLFSIEGAKTGDRIACFYPSDAVTYKDGFLVMQLPANQDGSEKTPVQLGFGKMSASAYAGTPVNLGVVPCMLRSTVQKGSFSIASAELRAIGGEKLAGLLMLDPATNKYTASDAAVNVKLKTPLDCRYADQNMIFYVAPVAAAHGFTIKYTTTDGDTFTQRIETPTEFVSGGIVETDPAASSARKLVACGSDKLYLFDAKIAHEEGTYKNALLWSWSSSKFNFGSSKDHIDDCKVVNDGKQFLVTCSNGNSWCALVNYPAGTVAFSVTGVTNAHSSELLPKGRIVAASSDGGDKVVLYDPERGSSVVASYPLSSCHGVVWVPSAQRLYAIGGSTLQEYSLVDWDGSNPSLRLEASYSTTGNVGGLHDMTLCSEDEIILAGSNNGGHSCAIFNTVSKKFTPVNHFNGIAGMKSINYNPATGEAYYTYAASGTSEGGYDWSSHKVRYTSDTTKPVSGDGTGSSNWSYIWVDDINMYKVRVYNW